MRIPFLHLPLDLLSAFAAGELDVDAHRRAAEHLRDCAECQESLRFIHQVNAPATAAPAPASDALLARIVASRESGARTILPAEHATAPRASMLGRVAAIAAVILMLVGLARVLAPREALAVSERSVLTIDPVMPTMGATIAVRYTPSPTEFPGATTLRLRARVRTPDNQAYAVPPAHLRVLGTLTRGKNGVYEGKVSLPDSVVFAVLAVESLDSARVDDNDGLGWEVLVAAQDGRPLFAALDQRSNDMMGRSWEQGYASIRQATELYPDSIHGWTTRDFFEGQLFSAAEGDSIKRVRSATIERLVARAKDAPSLGYSAMGSVYFRAYRIAVSPGGTKADSAEWDYWWARMRREYPKHEQIAQRLALWMDVKSIGNSAALDSLERLFAALSPLQGPAGGNLITRASQVAAAAGDARRERLWLARGLVGATDSVKRMALFSSSKPEFRDEGMQALRALLRPGTTGLVSVRALSRNAEQHERAIADARRTLFAALGRGLLAQGASRAALDTLRLAAEGGWDPTLYRELARSYALAGDSAAALAMQARLVVDPRTADARRDSLDRVGAQRLGAPAWATVVDEARREMHTRVLERSTVRAFAATTKIRSRDGVDHPLSELIAGKPALVIFWSRHCGFALEAIGKLVARLQAEGTPVVVAVDEAPSSELDAFFASKQITWPLYYDVGTRLGDAMRNFGTPSYVMLDRAGRIRFTYVDEVPDIIGRIAALNTEGR